MRDIERIMARLIWGLLTVFLLLAILAEGEGAFIAGKRSHTCDAMAAGMMMDDCPDSDNGMAGCVVSVCEAQVVPPSHQTFSVPILTECKFALSLRDDLLKRGLYGPPDLRPPIV